MRKLMLATIVAALGTALLATSASAFDPHFNVRVRYRSSHEPRPHVFVRKDKLIDPQHRRDRVGRDRLKCRRESHPFRYKCKLLIHLSGRIGGEGYIRARGDLQPGNDDRLNVVGGTRQFDGVAGKVSYEGYELHFDLVR